MDMSSCVKHTSILQIDILVKRDNSTIDVESMKKFYSRYNETSGMDIAVEMDKVKILQAILSKQLPPERYNGIINLLYIYNNPKATLTEITSALVICVKLKHSFEFESEIYLMKLKLYRYNSRTICTELTAMRQKHHFSIPSIFRIQV